MDSSLVANDVLTCVIFILSFVVSGSQKTTNGLSILNARNADDPSPILETAEAIVRLAITLVPAHCNGA